MKLFYSKILLFGEYGIIKNSKGLAIPYNFYKGTLKTLAEVEAGREEAARQSNEALRAFAGHLQALHGTSSGLDPLNSYLSLPILINSQDNIEPTGIPTQAPNGKGAVFLLDSGIIGETAPMVRIFMEQMKNEAFQKMLKEEFIKYTDACIDDFLKGRFKSLFGNIKNLSGIVLNHFKPMIPKEFHALWKEGIDTGDYFLKLCGSGGGGYILGFTEDLEKAKRSLHNHKLEVVYQF